MLDLGTLVDAIHVAAGSHLELRRLRIPNSGNRRLTRPSERVRLRVAGIFALWPSVTLAKDSQVRSCLCTSLRSEAAVPRPHCQAIHRNCTPA